MLGKLLKYDFKALNRILIPVHAAVLFVCAFACTAGFAIYFIHDCMDVPASLADVAGILQAMCALTVALSMALVFCAAVATFVVVIWRFYKNLFTDEGYLTLTLPATPGQIAAAKIIAGFVWMAADMVIVYGCLALVGASLEGFDPSMGLEESIAVLMLGAASGGVVDLVTTQGDLNGVIVFGWIMRSFVQIASTLLVAYAALSLGASAAARHKIAASVGIFLGITWGVGMVTGMVAIVIGFLFSTIAADAALNAISILGLVVQLALAAACWAVCVHVLKRKVNLP